VLKYGAGYVDDRRRTHIIIAVSLSGCMMEFTAVLRVLLGVAVLVTTLVMVNCDGSYTCPSRCQCVIKRRQQQQQIDGISGTAPGRRVVCQGGTAISDVTRAFVESLPRDTVQL
jgi:hypothetical protein